MKTFCLLTLLMRAWLPIVTAAENPVCCSKKELAPATPLSDRSLYQLDSNWTNDANASLKLASLRGKPQVVSMFFASCQFTCPVLVNDMKRIETALPDSVRTNIGCLVVSFETERDTPEALANYRETHRVPPNSTLRRGSPDDVLEVAALLGIKFKKDLRGQFAHSNVITVLNGDGEIMRQVPGLNRDVAETVRAIEQASAGLCTPTAAPN